MTITNQNIEIYRGDSATIHVDLSTEGAVFDPEVVPGLGIVWLLTKSAHADEAEALLRKDLTAGITMTTDGCDIGLTHQDTDLEPRLYYHELKIFNGAEVSTAMTGICTLRWALQPSP
jgi:hypothetical protein